MLKAFQIINIFLDGEHLHTRIDIFKDYAFTMVTNEHKFIVPGDYEYWNNFDEILQQFKLQLAILPGGVYVVCQPNADDYIQVRCNQHHTYLTNGDDGYCLMFKAMNLLITILDLIMVGDWYGDLDA